MEKDIPIRDILESDNILAEEIKKIKESTIIYTETDNIVIIPRLDIAVEISAINGACSIHTIKELIDKLMEGYI